MFSPSREESCKYSDVLKNVAVAIVSYTQLSLILRVCFKISMTSVGVNRADFTANLLFGDIDKFISPFNQPYLFA